MDCDIGDGDWVLFSESEALSGSPDIPSTQLPRPGVDQSGREKLVL